MDRFPAPCLVADVGGTNARFSSLGVDGAPTPMLRLDSGGDADFIGTVKRAIAEGGLPRPKSFLLAVAGPVFGRRATLTNARAAGGSLSVDGGALAEALDLEAGLLLNDFEALSLALPVLTADALVPLCGPATGADDAPLAVVGPGTGLGVGALVPHGGRWLPVASEGGHAGLGPATAEEATFWPHLGAAGLSAEDLLSGRGLARLHHAACAAAGAPVADAGPEAVTAMALAGTSETAVAAVRRLWRLLARFAGDIALVFGARGGLFIGGGIAPRLLPLLDRDDFAAAFCGEGRATPYRQTIPVRLIAAPDAALIGLAAVARRPEHFALDYEGRGWR
jgi:glucokinase